MPDPFFAPFFQHFAAVFDTYGFNFTAEQYDPDGYGSGLLRLSSERYFLDFTVSGAGPEVRMAIGRHDQTATDVAWIFASLTRARVPGVAETGGLPAPGLYFFPHLALNLWGGESVAWQAARLADVLQPLWAGMLIFLDMDGQRSTEFAALRKRIEREAAGRAGDGYQLVPGLAATAGDPGERIFPLMAQKSFAFLAAYDFQCALAAPRVVRFETDFGQDGPDPLYITVFQRPQSCALGVHTGKVAGSPGSELNFDMDELAAWHGLRYTAEIVRRDEGLAPALNRLSRLYRQMAAPVLAGDTRLFVALLNRRIDAARRASRVWADRNRGR